MTILKLEQSVQLHYLSEGDGPALLLFNGAGLPLTFWGETARQLACNHRVVRFDQRNAGNTRFEGSFTLNDVARDAALLLEHLGIDSATIIGHAWGGRVAQVFARDYAQMVGRMVICGTGGQFPPLDMGQWPEQYRTARRSGDRVAWEEALVAMFCAPGFNERQPGLFREVSDACWEKPIAQGRWDARVSPSRSYWGLADKPTLLLYGEHDKNGTPENARDLRDRLQARLVTIENAGHFVVVEKQAEVVRQIEDFLTETGR